MACAVRAVASSAGNSISSASSESVTSFGVPKTVTVLRKRHEAETGGDPERGGQPVGCPEGLRSFAIGGRRIGRDLVKQGLQDRVAASVDLLAKHAQRMGAPRGVVYDPRPHSRRMQGQAYGVHWRSHEIGRTALVKLRQGRVRHDDIPVSVDRHSRIGLVRFRIASMAIFAASSAASDRS